MPSAEMGRRFGLDGLKNAARHLMPSSGATRARAWLTVMPALLALVLGGCDAKTREFFEPPCCGPDGTPPPPLPVVEGIQGTVTVDGTGVAGVLATVTPGGLNDATDGAGQYGPIGVDAGSYTVTITNIPSGAVCPVTSKPANVPPNTIIVVNFACFTPASIVGTVTLDGAPFPTVSIDLTGPTPGGTVTDSLGDYGFSNLVPGDYTVAPVSLPAGITCTPASRAIALAGGQTARADFDCFSPGDVIAIVTLDAAPFPGVTVQVSGSATGSGVTNAQGRFELLGVPAGSVTTTISGLASGVTCSTTSQTGTIPPAGQLVLTFDCSTTAGIIGTVTLDGLPWAGTPVDLTGAVVSSATTDAAGNYLFAGLPAGSYTVTPGSLPPFVLCTPASQPVTLPLGSVIRVDFDCVSTGDVLATVTLDGNPYTNLPVHLTGTTTSTLDTDAQGQALFSGVPIGAVQVTLVGVPATVSCTPGTSQPLTVSPGALSTALFDCTTGTPPPASEILGEYGVAYSLISSTCGAPPPSQETMNVSESQGVWTITIARLTVPVTGTLDALTGRLQGTTGWQSIGGGLEVRESWDVFFTVGIGGKPVVSGLVVNEERDSSGTITCRSEFSVLGTHR